MPLLLFMRTISCEKGKPCLSMFCILFALWVWGGGGGEKPHCEDNSQPAPPPPSIWRSTRPRNGDGPKCQQYSILALIHSFIFWVGHSHFCFQSPIIWIINNLWKPGYCNFSFIQHTLQIHAFSSASPPLMQNTTMWVLYTGAVCQRKTSKHTHVTNPLKIQTRSFKSSKEGKSVIVLWLICKRTQTSGFLDKMLTFHSSQVQQAWWPGKIESLAKQNFPLWVLILILILIQMIFLLLCLWCVLGMTCWQPGLIH